MLCCFSYGDISAEAMFSDMDKLAVGVIIMFIYMQIVLSKFSWTEIRVSFLSHPYTNTLLIISILDHAGFIRAVECRHGLY